MYLLGGIDQQKKESERARSDGGELHPESRYFFEQFSEIPGARIAAPASTAGQPKVVDCAKRFLPLQTPDDTAERAGETADVVVQWFVFRSG